LAEKIASGDVAWLISDSSYTVSDGTVATYGTDTLNFSNASLETLRAAGYTKLTFTMSCVAMNGEEDNLKRIVCRWYNGSGYDASINKNDLGTGTPPTPSGTTKTVTFDLTEETCGTGFFIRLEAQYRTDIADKGVLTVTDLSVS